MAAASLSSGWSYHLGISRWWVHGLISFFSALAVYNFQRLYKLKTETPQTDWLLWVEKKKSYLTKLTAISATIAFVLFLLFTSFSVYNFLLLACLAFIAIIYVVPIKGKSLREIAGLKSFFIAFVWTGLIIIYPMLNGHVPLQLYTLHLIAFFCFFFALTIPFDIRDLRFDLPSQKTLPQVFGIVGSKIIACMMIVAFYVITANFNQEIWKSVLLGVFCMLSLVMIFCTKPQRSVYYFAMIDVLMIALGGLYFLI